MDSYTARQTDDGGGLPAGGRWIAPALLVGALGVLSAGAIIPFLAPSLRDAPWTDEPEELLNAIAGNPVAWAWANALFLGAAVVTAMGLVALVHRFVGQARVWAAMGAVVFALAAAAESVSRFISIGPAVTAAERTLAIEDPTVQAFVSLDAGLSRGFFVLGFGAVALFGLALAEDSARGWVFVGAGCVGAGLGLYGAGIPAFVYVATAALGLAVWSQGPPTW